MQVSRRSSVIHGAPTSASNRRGHRKHGGSSWLVFPESSPVRRMARLQPTYLPRWANADLQWQAEGSALPSANAARPHSNPKGQWGRHLFASLRSVFFWPGHAEPLGNNHELRQ
jgi:hypothetical protein